MPEYTVMAYNIEHMNKMFTNNAIKPTEVERAEKIAEVIRSINPHILGICEAANAPEEHQHFIDSYLSDTGYRLASGVSRGGQNLVYYYREPVSLVAIDEALSTYDPWDADVDQDGLKEQHKWERKPLEAVFRLGNDGPVCQLIMVHAKSKAIFTVVDLYRFQKRSLSNRMRLIAQAIHLRERLNQALDSSERLPMIVLGDMNDGPAMDSYEQTIGKSFVETAMGSVYKPEYIFHNALWWMTQDSQLKKGLWTADFPDPIVSHPYGYKHRVWIDHILLSPDMLNETNSVRYVDNSGRIGEKNQSSYKASDHFPVYCRIETD